MPKIDRTVTVDKPLEQVWNFLTDFTTTEQWDPGTVSTDRVTGDGAPGTVYKNVSKVLGREVEIEYTVVELEPMSLFRLHGKTSSMELHDTMRFEQTADGVSVTYIAEFDPQGAAKLIEPLMPLGLKKLGDDAAASLSDALAKL
jgi:carbon monoxide dehydrogenase subunit G